jgi:hypothetical protein
MDAPDISEFLSLIKLHSLTSKENLTFRMKEINCHNWHCIPDTEDENWYYRNDDAENKTISKRIKRGLTNLRLCS